MHGKLRRFYFNHKFIQSPFLRQVKCKEILSSTPNIMNNDKACKLTLIGSAYKAAGDQRGRGRQKDPNTGDGTDFDG